MLEIGYKLESCVTYDEAVMLAFCEGDGWRLPTLSEWWHDSRLSGCWFTGRSTEYKTLSVILVRDLKDD
jgi:hypothetical protein